MDKPTHLPETNHLGSRHHSLYLGGTEVYNRLHTEGITLASNWSEKALVEFSQDLDSTPADVVRGGSEIRLRRSTILSGNLRRQCAYWRAPTLRSSASLRAFLKQEWQLSVEYPSGTYQFSLLNYVFSRQRFTSAQNITTTRNSDILQLLKSYFVYLTLQYSFI